MTAGADVPVDATLVLTDTQFAELASAAAQPMESGAVLLGALQETEGRFRFVVTDIRWVPDDSYLDRREDGLRVSNTGFLPAPLRDAMGLTWTPRQERRFRAVNRWTGRISRRLPPVVRAVPFNTFLWDVRRRHRAGKPLV